jgi:hypothetical protein
MCTRIRLVDAAMQRKSLARTIAALLHTILSYARQALRLEEAETGVSRCNEIAIGQTRADIAGCSMHIAALK